MPLPISFQNSMLSKGAFTAGATPEETIAIEDNIPLQIGMAILQHKDRACDIGHILKWMVKTFPERYAEDYFDATFRKCSPSEWMIQVKEAFWKWDSLFGIPQPTIRSRGGLDGLERKFDPLEYRIRAGQEHRFLSLSSFHVNADATFRFNDLERKIRALIFQKLVVYEDMVIHVKSPTRRSFLTNVKGNRQIQMEVDIPHNLAIVRTCKRYCDEARKIFYTLNKFEVNLGRVLPWGRPSSTPKGLNRFLRLLPAGCRHDIAFLNISVRSPWDEYGVPTLKSLVAFTCLRELSITTEDERFRPDRESYSPDIYGLESAVQELILVKVVVFNGKRFTGQNLRQFDQTPLHTLPDHKKEGN